MLKSLHAHFDVKLNQSYAILLGYVHSESLAEALDMMFFVVISKKKNSQGMLPTTNQTMIYLYRQTCSIGSVGMKLNNSLTHLDDFVVIKPTKAPVQKLNLPVAFSIYLILLLR